MLDSFEWLREVCTTVFVLLGLSGDGLWGVFLHPRSNLFVLHDSEKRAQNKRRKPPSEGCHPPSWICLVVCAGVDLCHNWFWTRSFTWIHSICDEWMGSEFSWSQWIDGFLVCVSCQCVCFCQLWSLVYLFVFYMSERWRVTADHIISNRVLMDTSQNGRMMGYGACSDVVNQTLSLFVFGETLGEHQWNDGGDREWRREVGWWFFVSIQFHLWWWWWQWREMKVSECLFCVAHTWRSMRWSVVFSLLCFCLCGLY